MKIAYTERAADDLEAIGEFLNTRSAQGARSVQAALLRTLESLAVFPRAGRLQATADVRKIGVRKYPYLIYYAVDLPQQTITVLTIQHAARQRIFTDL